ncbi:MAG: hypothetical protein ACPGWM_08635, partial [Flavobacteriales bacterium]
MFSNYSSQILYFHDAELLARNEKKIAAKDILRQRVVCRQMVFCGKRELGLRVLNISLDR